MTKRTVNYDEDYSPSSSRDYTGNQSNLETAVVKNYDSQNSGTKPAKRRGKNHSADIFQIDGNGDYALGVYFRQIRDYQPLSSEEEIALAQRIAEGDESAKNRLVEANLRFVVSVAKEYQNMGLTLLELISEGNIGLIESAERFDGTRGFKFISYAVWWIRQGILKALSERSGRIDDSEQGKLMRDISALQQRFGRDLTIYEMALELGLSVKKLERRLFEKRTPVSIDKEISNKNGKNNGKNDMTLLDTLQSSDPTPEETYDEMDRRYEVDKALGIIDEREERVCRLYFGVNDYQEDFTLEKIGDMIGVTRERIRQIRDKALKKIRESDCFQDYKE